MLVPSPAETRGKADERRPFPPESAQSAPRTTFAAPTPLSRAHPGPTRCHMEWPMRILMHVRRRTHARTQRRANVNDARRWTPPCDPHWKLTTSRPLPARRVGVVACHSRRSLRRRPAQLAVWSRRPDHCRCADVRRHLSNSRGRANENATTEAARGRHLDRSGADRRRRRRRDGERRVVLDRAAPRRAGASAAHRTRVHRRRRRLLLRVRRGPRGCMQPRHAERPIPLDITTDYGPGTFNAYGLARDGVVAVEIRIGGSSRPAAFGHNSFTFWDASLGGTERRMGEIDRDDGRRNDARGGVPRRAPRQHPRRIAMMRRTVRRAFWGRSANGACHRRASCASVAVAVRDPVRRSGGAGPGASHPSGSAIVTQGLLAGVAQW